jgi:hypothetical protein
MPATEEADDVVILLDAQKHNGAVDPYRMYRSICFKEPHLRPNEAYIMV